MPKTICISQNLDFYMPDCCFLKYESSNLHENVKNSIQTIQTTKIGKRLLDQIADSSHSIVLTTHPLQNSCESFFTENSLLFTKPFDFDASFNFTKGSSSYIFINPTINENLPWFYTSYHQEFCQSKSRFSIVCTPKKSLCVRQTKFINMLFHELVHANNNQKGLNKKNDKNVPPIFRNLEEKETIEKENQFIRELMPKGEIDLIPKNATTRYGHMSVDSYLNHLFHDKTSFFTEKLPQFILGLKSNHWLYPKSPTEENKTYISDESLYEC